MGLAFYNNMFVDMPVVPACYKILLESKNGFKKLEEIVGRSFTVDFE
jgi:hypothetical protein